MKKLSSLKKEYYLYLDRKARNLARLFLQKKPGTKLLLDYIGELYDSAKTDAAFLNKNFEAAYHNPISSELEFLIARSLFHYSNFKKLGWKIYLRRQVGKTAPDIRIAKNGKTVSIIEVKAKAGFIQPFFNSDRMKKDMLKLKTGISDFNPKDLIKKVGMQFKKYYKEYSIRPDQVFIFLPSLIHVHRKSSSRKMSDYEKDFSKNAGLPKSNLILLSNNLSLNLSINHDRKEYKPTDRLERLFRALEKIN